MGTVRMAPAATFPPVAVKPVGRFGKSIATVPANPEMGTTCTPTCKVPPGSTKAGLAGDVTGVTWSVKSLITFKKSVAVLIAPELSVPRTVINAGPGEIKKIGRAHV